MGRKKEPLNPTRVFFRREFDVKVVDEYERLKDVGRLSQEDLRDRFKLSEAINEAGRNAHRANMIAVKAKKEREFFRVEFNRRNREVRRTALARIGSWLEATGNKRKQITKDMIDEEVAAHEDTRTEYEELMREQEELREIRDNLRNLADQWSDRKSSLQTQARLLSAQKEVVLGRNR